MENYVRLIVLSKNLDPEQISDQLGLFGDETWKVGDRRKNTIILEKENGWILHSREEKSSDLEHHIESIKSIINGYESNLMTISEKKYCSVQLSCAIYCENEPPLFFEKGIISWLNSIGASLDIDLYLSRLC